MTTQRKTLRHFLAEIDWSTRIYLLMALAVVAGALIFQTWALTIAFALVVVLFAESLILSIQHHPATWRTIGWWVLLLLLALLLIGHA